MAAAGIIRNSAACILSSIMRLHYRHWTQTAQVDGYS